MTRQSSCKQLETIPDATSSPASPSIVIANILRAYANPQKFISYRHHRGFAINLAEQLEKPEKASLTLLECKDFVNNKVTEYTKTHTIKSNGTFQETLNSIQNVADNFEHNKNSFIYGPISLDTFLYILSFCDMRTFSVGFRLCKYITNSEQAKNAKTLRMRTFSEQEGIGEWDRREDLAHLRRYQSAKDLIDRQVCTPSNLLSRIFREPPNALKLMENALISHDTYTIMALLRKYYFLNLLNVKFNEFIPEHGAGEISILKLVENKSVRCYENVSAITVIFINFLEIYKKIIMDNNLTMMSLKDDYRSLIHWIMQDQMRYLPKNETETFEIDGIYRIKHPNPIDLTMMITALADEIRLMKYHTEMECETNIAFTINELSTFQDEINEINVYFQLSATEESMISGDFTVMKKYFIQAVSLNKDIAERWLNEAVRDKRLPLNMLESLQLNRAIDRIDQTLSRMYFQ